MSKYSGKCDLYDSLEICGALVNGKPKTYFKNDMSNITIYDTNHKKMNFERLKDLMPYFGYELASSAKSGNSYTFFLGKMSVPDKIEKDHYEFCKELLLKYAKHCKKDKRPYTYQEALLIFNSTDPELEKLSKRVAEYGKKATIEGLKYEMSNYYRSILAEDIKKCLV